jgi:hypothetical protein
MDKYVVEHLQTCRRIRRRKIIPAPESQPHGAFFILKAGDLFIIFQKAPVRQPPFIITVTPGDISSIKIGQHIAHSQQISSFLYIESVAKAVILITEIIKKITKIDLSNGKISVIIF